jgi:branched-chain amino acid transport system permease protein
MTAVALSGLWVFLKRTLLGRSIDAVSQNFLGATLVGVNTRNALCFACGLSAALAAAAGAMIAPITLVAPYMWIFPLIKAFAIAILGGMGSLAGGIVASFILGYSEILAAFIISEKYTEVTSLILIILVLLFRPAGILGFRLKR